MRKTALLTLSLLMVSAMLAGSANAGPKITDKNYFPNEVHAQSGHGIKPQETDWRKARASANRGRALPLVDQKDAPTWHYQGGPKLPPSYW